MTYEEANFVKHLAKPCYKAIQAIAGERKCPECKGLKYGKFPPQQKYRERCEFCNGTGKVGWKWKEREGDYILLDDEVYLLFPTRDGLGYDAGISCGRSTDYTDEKYYDDFTQDTKDVCIPILGWERIEEILEGVGYYLQMNKPLNVYIERGSMKVGCSIYQTGRDDFIIFTQAKSRQEVVMLAVIELSKRR